MIIELRSNRTNVIRILSINLSTFRLFSIGSTCICICSSTRLIRSNIRNIDFYLHVIFHSKSREKISRLSVIHRCLELIIIIIIEYLILRRAQRSEWSSNFPEFKVIPIIFNVLNVQVRSMHVQHGELQWFRESKKRSC